MDRALIESIADGDKRAMQVLYARHNVRIYRFIEHLIGNSSVAEDLVSDVFLDTWRRADGFEAKSRVSTWLLAIARYKALSELRRRAHEQLDEHTTASIEDPADNPEITMHKTARSEIIRKCLGQLSSAHREVMNLVLPRQIDRRGSRDRWRSDKYGQDAHVLRASSTGGAAS